MSQEGWIPLKDIRNSRQFCYTQQSLTAFENCPLKFKKRYMEGLRWDSLPDEETKASLDRGNSFHLLARRYFSGIPYGLDENAKDFELLSKWLRSLETYFLIKSEAVYLPEHTLSAELDGLILEANYDLIILEDGHLRIWDWKTHALEKGNCDGAYNESFSNMRKKLESSLQTMVYMYALKERAASLTGGLVGGTFISMKYWQPDPPYIIAEVNYDAKTHDSFRSHLSQLLKKIREYDFSTFDKSLYSKHCKRCEFNWYCNGI